MATLFFLEKCGKSSPWCVLVINQNARFMEKAKTDTLASTHRAISEILRNYVADEDARLELDYKIFCILKKHTEKLNPEDSLLCLLEEFSTFAK